MDDAERPGGLRENGLDGLRQAGQAITTGDENVLEAAVLQVGQDGEPELTALSFGEPQAENIFASFHVDADSHIDRLRQDVPVVPDFYAQAVQREDRIMAFQRTGLPRRQLGHDLFRNDGNQLRRHLGLVDVIQVALDVLCRKPSGIQGDDFLVEVRQAALILLNNDRIEAAVAIARHLERDFAAVRLQSLGAIPIGRLEVSEGASSWAL